MSLPFFSVIIAAYNKAQSIRTTLDSLLRQTFADFEIIVVDDGSVDETAMVVRRYASSNIKYIYQENQGVTAARNKGVEWSSGRYLAFLDADDWVAADWLEQYYCILSTIEYDFVFCDVEIRDQTKQKSKVTKARFPYRDTVEDRNGLFLTGAFCVERNYFLKIGKYDSRIRFGENAELSMRTIQGKPFVSFTDKIGLYYEIGIDGGSKSWENRINDTLYIISKHAEFFIEYPHVKRLYIQSIAFAYEKKKEYRKAIKFHFKSWKMRPLYIHNISRLIRAFYRLIKSSFNFL